MCFALVCITGLLKFTVLSKSTAQRTNARSHNHSTCTWQHLIGMMKWNHFTKPGYSDPAPPGLWWFTSYKMSFHFFSLFLNCEQFTAEKHNHVQVCTIGHNDSPHVYFVILLCYSPPVSWGLLDFMSVSSPPPVLLLVLLPRPPPVAILWVQCGVPGSNRDPASSVWRAGPQPRAREFSVACRTPTAILRVQCGVPDPNRDPVSSAWRAGPQVLCQKICQKEWQKICQKECQKICQKKCQKDMSEDMSERMSKDMSERC